MEQQPTAEIECNNFFDSFEDLLLDFPEDNNNNNNKENAVFIGGADNGCDSFPGLWLDDDDTDGLFINPNSVFIGKGSRDLVAEISVPYEDIVQLEWLSTFVEDSFSGGNSMTLDKDQFSKSKEVVAANQFCSASPISVLESSSSSSSTSSSSIEGKALPPSHALVPVKGGRGRARSKRPRPPTFVSPAQSFTDMHQGFVSDGEKFIECLSVTKVPRISGQNKKRKNKVSTSSALPETHSRRNDASIDASASQSQAAVRKCLHCQVTKTPQWRAGPMGPKTLCNACGVRHKSGRLFPEYRPAASPTFVVSLHSNSHKKVVEMRTSSLEVPATTTKMSKVTMPSLEAQPEFIPNKDAMLDTCEV